MGRYDTIEKVPDRESPRFRFFVTADNATNSLEPHDDACQHVSLRDDLPPFAESHARHTSAPILINPPDSDTRDHSSPSSTPYFLDLTGLIQITT